MGGNYPMPTIVSKGPILLALDQRYRRVDWRMRSLERLRRNDVISSAVEGDLVTKEDKDHLVDDWYTSPGFWNAIYQSATDPDIWEHAPVPQEVLDHAKDIVKAALVYGLELSMGLAPGQPVPFVNGKPDVSQIPPNVRKQVRVNWVCGKANGFEAQVVWSEDQIDVYILTPPIKYAVGTLLYDFTQAEADAARREPAGMVLITYDTNLGQTRVQHVDKREGGVVQCADQTPRSIGQVAAAGPRARYSDEVVVDDCSGGLGRTTNDDDGPPSLAKSLRKRVESDAGTEFRGLNAISVELNHVSTAQSTYWAHATVRARHQYVNNAPPNETFLGWRPTGESVKFDVTISGTYEGTTVTDLTFSWDRLNVHAQLGVRAVGRPVLR